MRTIGSISSDLCEMQRLRDNNIALGAKDLEWQTRITRAAAVAASLQALPMTSSSTAGATVAAAPPANPFQQLPTSSKPPLPLAMSTSTAAVPLPALSSSPSDVAAAAAAAAVAVSVAPVPPPSSSSYMAEPGFAPSPDRMPSDQSSTSTHDASRNSLAEHDAHTHVHIRPSPTLTDTTSPHLASTRTPTPIAPSAHNTIVASSTVATTVAHPHLHPHLDPHLDPHSHLDHRIPDLPGAEKHIAKIRRHRMTKEEEARFNPVDLKDLSGSTAAKSRKMTDDERDIMLHKRRLRNRASAARSRDKQRKTINDISDELQEIYEYAERVMQRCLLSEQKITTLEKEKDMLFKENGELKKKNYSLMLTPAIIQPPLQPAHIGMSPPAPTLKRTGSTLRLSMSGDMLDKLISTTSAGGDPGATGTAAWAKGVVKVPSKLRLSVSTDQLCDGQFPFMSGSLPPLSRNASVMERLLDLASTNGGLDLNCDVEVKE